MRTTQKECPMMVFNNEAETACRKSYKAIVVYVIRKYPSLYEFAQDIVSDAFLETVQKYPDKTSLHMVNIWRLKSLNRSVNFMIRRRHLVRFSDMGVISGEPAQYLCR